MASCMAKIHPRFLLLLGLLLLAVAPPSLQAAQKTPPPLVGILMVSLEPLLAQDLGLPADRRGVLIVCVQEGSPAAAAGLREGDVITRIKNAKRKEVALTGTEAFQATLGELPAAKPVEMTVHRTGQEMPFSILRAQGPFGPPPQPQPNAAPRTIKVAADGSGDTRTPIGAIFASRPGDKILIGGGKHGDLIVWRDGLAIGPLDPKESVTLSSVHLYCASRVTVMNLAVNAPAAGACTGGLHVEYGADNVIKGCLARGFSLGIYAQGTKNAVIEGNTVAGNTGGIAIYNAATAKVTGNLVIKNAVPRPVAATIFSGGIEVAGSQAELSNNTILENRIRNDDFAVRLGETYGYPPGIGVSIYGKSTVSAYNNIVYFNNIGFLISPTATYTIEYNDVFQHRLDTKVWNPKAFHEYRLVGGNANFLSEIKYDYVMAPTFSFGTPHRTTYTPVPCQVSQTNLSMDPLFADPLGGDYRLAKDSPLIAKGRGGGFIGALPPVESAPQSPRGTAPGTPATPTAPTGTPNEPHALIRDGTIYVDPAALDALIGKLCARINANPALKEQQAKTTLGLLAFEPIGLQGLALSKDFMENLMTSLINGGFKPADLVKLAQVLKELSVQHGGEVDQNIARQIGERTGCGLLLLGTIADYPDKLVMNVKLMEVATGSFLAAERLEVKKAAIQGS